MADSNIQPITREEINNILRRYMGYLPGRDSRVVAELAYAAIAKEDREEALILLLMNQVSHVLRYDSPPARLSRNNDIATIRDSGIDPIEADKSLGRAAPMAHRVWARSKAREISQREARLQLKNEDEAAYEKARTGLRQAISEMAVINHKAEIADALLDRVIMVRGVYKNLLTCTLEEVEWLAERATNVAIGHAESASFYLDIANRMKERHAEVVSEIATAVVA